MSRIVRSIVAAVGVCLCAGWALGKDAPKPDVRQEGTQKVKFVKLTEVPVNDGMNLALVVQPLEGERTATLIVPRKNADMMAAARKLREGQILAVSWVAERDQKWLRRVEVAGGGEGDRPKAEGETKVGAKNEGELKDRPKAEGELKNRAKGEREPVPESEFKAKERSSADRTAGQDGETTAKPRAEGDGAAKERAKETPAARIEAERTETRQAMKRMQGRIEELEKQVQALREEIQALKK